MLNSDESAIYWRETMDLPVARIKAIMRSDPATHLVSQDAAFAVCRATVSIPFPSTHHLR
jgi:hypothetical protein